MEKLENNNSVSLSESATFEGIRQINQHGAEFWHARDLQPLLGYSQWRRFEQAIERATFACKQSGNEPQHHFAGAGKMIPWPKGASLKRSSMNNY